MASKKQEWEIVILDCWAKRWPSAKSLAETGVPLAVVERYRKVRRDMTAGLKRRVKEAVN